MSTSELAVQRGTGTIPRSARWLLRLLERLQVGRLDVISPEGRRLQFLGASEGPVAALHVHDWRMAGNLLRAGDIGFAEAFLDGRWSSPDLTAVLELAALNRCALDGVIRGSRLGKLYYRLRHLLRRNSRRGARRNIHAHYDLGNDFYRAWLDSGMTYSAALFSGDPAKTLEDAQSAKYRRIVEQLGVGPGHRLLEIGCGWGGFAEHAARCGAQVHGITISAAQLDYARRRLADAQVSDRCRVELLDYRDVQGQYDFIVSIEMFEAVGEAYWREYFAVLRERLRPGGTALVQVIVIDDALFEDYRRGTDFIQQYVFPGGMLPSASAFRARAAQAGLKVRDEFRFGADYARTLRGWRERYNAAASGLRRLGFDERFERLWNFYLCYCEAGFRAGNIDVMQWTLARD